MYFTWSKILVSLGNIPIECRLSIPLLGQGLVFFLQGGGGWVHLCISLLHVVDLVVLPLLVPRDFPVRLRKLVTIFTLELCPFIWRSVLGTDKGSVPAQVRHSLTSPP